MFRHFTRGRVTKITTLNMVSGKYEHLYRLRKYKKRKTGKGYTVVIIKIRA